MRIVNFDAHGKRTFVALTLSTCRPVQGWQMADEMVSPIASMCQTCRKLNRELVGLGRARGCSDSNQLLDSSAGKQS
jgi:hypothetical protein